MVTSVTLSCRCHAWQSGGDVDSEPLRSRTPRSLGFYQGILLHHWYPVLVPVWPCGCCGLYFRSCPKGLRLCHFTRCSVGYLLNARTCHCGPAFRKFARVVKTARRMMLTPNMLISTVSTTGIHILCPHFYKYSFSLFVFLESGRKCTVER